MDAQGFRTPSAPVDPLFIDRWSPRAMSGEDIPDETLMSLFEAARWAPSAANNQPWRFLYARRQSPHWSLFSELPNELNRVWASKAAVLVVVLSKQTFDSTGKFSRTHTYDCGAAWENLALQGTRLGLVIHGMQGFDYDKARAALRVPEAYDVEAMIAIGKPGAKEDLPENLREREFPSPRKPLSEIAAEGLFPF